MTCKHGTRRKNKRLEYVGHLHFAASTYDLNSIPDTTHKKQEYDLLNAGYVRLQVVLERVVGKRTMERVYS